MGKIILLDELTSSQIAAGEVVERPASVVKEMVENSIDAGSTRISVEIKNGGIKYIKIDDNGSGMEPDDCIIAFDKHATSKIKSSDDLFSISTLGFRGEALASIAAVSRVTLRTKTRSNENGTYVVIEGGELIESGQCGAKDGTSFTVENLFYNTPARYKFLMRDQTEASYVAEAMERIALSHPEISFRLTSDKKQLLFTPGGDLLTAIYGVFGKDISDKVVSCAFSEDNVKVTGFCGKKELTYGNRNRQIAFVNGRFVKSKTVSAAIDEAYRTLTMKGRFPFAVLNIELPFSRVDVNVHPAKTEVRFADNNQVFRAVYHAITSAIYEQIEQPAEFHETSKVETVSETPAVYTAPKAPETPETVIPKTTETVISKTPEINVKSEFKPSEPKTSDAAANAPLAEYIKKKYEEPLGTKEQGFFSGLDIGVKSGKVITKSEVKEEPKDPQFTGEFFDVYKYGRVIGQLLETYILLEFNGAFYMIDQHAAHERLKYEEIKSRLLGNDNSSSELLLPITVRLGASEMIRFNEIREALEKLGFEIDEFGADSIIIRSIPTMLSESNAESFVVTAIGSPRTGEGMINVFPDHAVYTMACKAAIKGNMKLSDVEIRSLLDKLATVKNPGTCPHGRPIILKMTQYEIERRFHRA
ncbi:MAG: DNA mismatch repair endonuclease MutL [Clostridia bacterium]|nr:DNA mismatch repair endonuclease MutL [Clostridia bacterium]